MSMLIYAYAQHMHGRREGRDRYAPFSSYAAYAAYVFLDIRVNTILSRDVSCLLLLHNVSTVHSYCLFFHPTPSSSTPPLSSFIFSSYLPSLSLCLLFIFILQRILLQLHLSYTSPLIPFPGSYSFMSICKYEFPQRFTSLINFLLTSNDNISNGNSPFRFFPLFTNQTPISFFTFRRLFPCKINISITFLTEPAFNTVMDQKTRRIRVQMQDGIGNNSSY